MGCGCGASKVKRGTRQVVRKKTTSNPFRTASAPVKIRRVEIRRPSR